MRHGWEIPKLVVFLFDILMIDVFLLISSLRWEALVQMDTAGAVDRGKRTARSQYRRWVGRRKN